MTDKPVAAAKARTMWKRDIPAMAATSSSVSSPARWLSINQSAFSAGFISSSPHSKPLHYDGFARASFDRPCSRKTATGRQETLFRFVENSGEGNAGNVNPIVHTGPWHLAD